MCRQHAQADRDPSAMLYMTLYFESVCFPSIVALGIRGLGRHYKRGSGFIVGGVCGTTCMGARDMD
jgi:FHS family L-fucose permease-like MFS transporter